MGNRLFSNVNPFDTSTSISSSNTKLEKLSNFNSQKYADDEPMNDQLSAKLNDISSNEIQNLVNITMHLKYKTIRSSPFSDQSFPMLVSLEVNNSQEVNRAPIDLVVVLDRSGSMQGTKIQSVKNTFNYLLKYLGDLDRLSIVTFNDQASRILPLMRTTEANKQRILSVIKNVEAGGGTDIHRALMHGFQILQERREFNAVSSIFLLSDGLDSSAIGKITGSLTHYEIPLDLSIHTFGYGYDHDPKMMTEIADLRGGSFYFIEKLDTIDEMFIDCLGGLQSSITENVELRIKPESSKILQGVKIAQGYGPSSLWEQHNGTFTTKLPRLISGRQRDFVLELKLPPNNKIIHDNEKKIKVASCEAIIHTFDDKQIVKKGELYITLLNENEESKQEEKPNREVLNHFFRLKTSTTLQEAREFADRGMFEDAKKLLRDFKEELENSVMKNEKVVKDLIGDMERAMREVSPQVYGQGGQPTISCMERGHRFQQSNFATIGVYQNAGQERMIRHVQAMKNNK